VIYFTPAFFLSRSFRQNNSKIPKNDNQ